MEERKQSVRIQTSILNAGEKKILVWMAQRMPRWINSDTLTAIGLVGALIIAAGYALSNLDIRWIWLANLGLLVNWFGDSLDGTLARVRNAQRPIYGFYLDHNIDVINEVIMFLGAGLSPLVNFSVAACALAAYLMISVYVYISAHLKNEFKLTYAGLGPTEFRVIIFLANIIFIYVKPIVAFKYELTLFGSPISLGILDFIAIAITVTLVIMFLVSFFKDARYFSRLDPPKKWQ
ncbi:MAG: CDP-alcohol phosphatidyltransferase family protein [Bacteroidales bacterium]|nr:CDP-alcohol phosphatidyltransferase family protein [Bacteroidales bacterium]